MYSTKVFALLRFHCTGVYKQRLFTYTGKEDHLLWEEYGIELHFPSTSAVDIECAVSVISTDDDNYIFPESSKLVSAVYDISVDQSFPEPVTVKVQHCVPIENDQKAQAMSFVIANTAQGPPYQFKRQREGRFSCESFYAEIQLRHFSILAIIIEWYKSLVTYPLVYSANVYYLENIKVSFVMTRNLAAHISVSTFTLCYMYVL